MRVIQWQPDLLIGDLRWEPLDTLRERLRCEAWLLMRIWPKPWTEPRDWRVFAIEPGVGMGIRESVPPIVGSRRVWPEDGATLPASYNHWHEAIRYGYANRVVWEFGAFEERRRRIAAGAERASDNGADVLVAQILGRLARDGEAMTMVKAATPNSAIPK